MINILSDQHFSLIIPCFNEAPNIKKLFFEIEKYLKDFEYEIIFINDASTDNSLETIKEVKSEKNITILNNELNMGQSFSIYKGIKNAKYNNIITIDCDGQNNPKDIIKLINKYFNSPSYDLVGGLRLKRKDTLIKIISSRIANLIRSFILRDKCNDTGCSLKIFKRDIFLKYEFFDGIHRFIPALFSGLGKKTIFVEVDHRYREFGVSKYGTFKRALNGIFDIYRVLKIIRKVNK